MSRASQRCAYRETRPDNGIDKRFAECGRTYFLEAKEGWPVTCPKCSAAVAKRALAARTDLAFGQPIRDEVWLRHESLRSIWPVKHDGKLVGFATVKAGWGNGWRIHRVERDGSMGCLVGMEYSTKDTYASKEAALLAVALYIADGRLCAPEDAAAAVERRRAADRRDEAERQRKREEDQRAEDELRDGLASIAALPLSNLQRHALAAIYKRSFYRELPLGMGRVPA